VALGSIAPWRQRAHVFPGRAVGVQPLAEELTNLHGHLLVAPLEGSPHAGQPLCGDGGIRRNPGDAFAAEVDAARVIGVVQQQLSGFGRAVHTHGLHGKRGVDARDLACLPKLFMPGHGVMVVDA
jgi:hypothetical protein